MKAMNMEKIQIKLIDWILTYDPGNGSLTATLDGVTRTIASGLQKAVGHEEHRVGLEGSLRGLLRQPIWGQDHCQHLPQLLTCEFDDVLKARRTDERLKAQKDLEASNVA
jgi:hypothetical protein